MFYDSNPTNIQSPKSDVIPPLEDIKPLSTNCLNGSPASLKSDNLTVCGSPVYDSGNFTFSWASECSAQLEYSFEADDEPNPYSLVNVKENSTNLKLLNEHLKEKSRALAEILQVNEQLKSELERCAKSEQWYKAELKSQKRSKLDLLENLYLTERKYIKENQNLQKEYLNAKALCEDIKRNGLQEKIDLQNKIEKLESIISLKCIDTENFSLNLLEGLKFDLKKQESIAAEQKKVIEILRKQKVCLLNDLSNANSLKDATILKLEANILLLEEENRKITQRCLEAIKVQKNAEHDIEQYLIEINELKAVNSNLQDHISIQKTEPRFEKIIEEPLYKNLEEKEVDLELEQLKISNKYQNDEIAKLRAEVVYYQKMLKFYNETFELDTGTIKNSNEIDLNLIISTQDCDPMQKVERTKDLKPIVAVKPTQMQNCRNEDNLNRIRTRKDDREDSIRVNNKVITDELVVNKRPNIPRHDKVDITSAQRISKNATTLEPVPNILLENLPIDLSVEVSKYILVDSRTNSCEDSVAYKSGIKNLGTSDICAEKACHLEISKSNDLKAKFHNEKNDIRKLEIFCRVLQTEQRKKCYRYELHISTLLKNITAYKKSIEAAEKKVQTLEKQLQKQKTIEKPLTKSIGTLTNEIVRNSKVYCPKCKSNESYLNMKENLNKNLHYQISQTDEYKKISKEQELHLRNMVNIYQKTMSSLNSNKRPKTDYEKIYRLIEQSNNYVPKFDSLVRQIANLKIDIKNIDGDNDKTGIKTYSTCISLMDELKAVDPSIVNA